MHAAVDVSNHRIRLGRPEAEHLVLANASAACAENLVLRRQLARYIDGGVKPRRVDHMTRVSLALFSRLDWCDAVLNVRPATIIRSHRMGWRIFWRWKCSAARPAIPAELRSLIRQMAAEKRLWGEERIADELLITSPASRS